MIVGLENLDRLIKIETSRALKETLGSFMGDESSDQHSERRRQKQQAKATSDRGLSKGVAEAEEDAVEEAEEETTGVPEDVDAEDAGAAREDRTGGKGTKDSPKLKTPSRRKLEKVTIGSVIDKLNALRGGKSLKDQEVQKSFNQYFESLTDKEKQSMLVFLTGIAQILAGTKKGTEVIDPGDIGLRVKGDIAKSKQPTKPSPQDKKSAAPIVVGESIINSRVKKAIKAYKKIQDMA